MTLLTVAQEVFDAAQTGPLETLDQPLELLGETLRQNLLNEDLRGAQRLLEEARTALYVRRAHIVRALQQSQRGTLYGDAKSTLTSWEFSG